MQAIIILTILSVDQSIAWILGTLSACLTIFFTVNTYLNKKLEKKADKEEVQKDFLLMKKEIGKKANQEFVETLDGDIKEIKASQIIISEDIKELLRRKR